MFARAVSVGFTGLSHQVVDEDLGGARLADYTSHLGDQKVWQNARVERAWTNRDDVCGANGFESFGQGKTLFRLESQLANRNFGSGDLSLTANDGSIFEFCCEPDVANRRGIYVTLACENLRRDANRFIESPVTSVNAAKNRFPKL